MPSRHRSCNLVLVPNSGVNHEEGFRKIREHLARTDPWIRVHIIKDRTKNSWHALHLWARPTLVFSPIKLNHLFFLRGRVFQGNPLTKSQECTALQRAGLPVPRWTVVTPEHTGDLDGFGEYVVMKPDAGWQGADVKIVRRDRVRWREPKTRSARRSSCWLVQEFVYTGSWPVSYRVTTLFGKVLWSLRVEADHSRRPLKDRYAFRGGEGVGGMSIVSSGKGCRFRLNHDREIISLAERAHRAFPDIPLLGVDILREQPTGRLYIVEVNAIGFTWLFSSPRGKRVQEQFGINLEAQFDGLRKAAGILAEKTRELAR